jgi:hypothetical protein
VTSSPQPNQGVPDLTFIGASIPNSTKRGQGFYVSFSLKNLGPQSAGRFNVRWISDVAGSIVGCSWEVNTIGPQEALKLDCNFPGYPQAGVYHWQILADADNEVNETDDQNNTMSGQINVTN